MEAGLRDRAGGATSVPDHQCAKHQISSRIRGGSAEQRHRHVAPAASRDLQFAHQYSVPARGLSDSSDLAMHRDGMGQIDITM